MNTIGKLLIMGMLLCGSACAENFDHELHEYLSGSKSSTVQRVQVFKHSEKDIYGIMLVDDGSVTDDLEKEAKAIDGLSGLFLKHKRNVSAAYVCPEAENGIGAQLHALNTINFRKIFGVKDFCFEKHFSLDDFMHEVKQISYLLDVFSVAHFLPSIFDDNDTIDRWICAHSMSNRSFVILLESEQKRAQFCARMQEKWQFEKKYKWRDFARTNKLQITPPSTIISPYWWV